MTTQPASTPSPTQTVIPGTADSAPANSPAQAPSPVSAAPAFSQADIDAANARAAKAEKQLAAFQKRIEDGSLVQEHLNKVLGLDKKEDPQAVIQRMQAETQLATSRAAEIESKAKRALVNATVQSLAGKFGVRSDAREDLPLFLDTSGVEVDLDAGRVVNTKILEDRITALKSTKAFIFDMPKSEPAKSPLPGPTMAPVNAPPQAVADGAPIVLDAMNAFLGPKNQLDAHLARTRKTQTV